MKNIDTIGEYNFQQDLFPGAPRLVWQPIDTAPRDGNREGLELRLRSLANELAQAAGGNN
ncbi:MAG: hypothetical protein ACRCWR_00905 [Saezia sp.]